MGVDWSGRVFISHDREDRGYAARSLVATLREQLPQCDVVFDADQAERDQEWRDRDWRDQIRKLVSDCDVLLALIGPNWSAERRHNLNNGVRVELEAAFNHDVPVVVVLVDGAGLPDASTLPNELEVLAFRPGYQLRHDDWNNDTDRLLERITRSQRPAESPSTMPGSRRASTPTPSPESTLDLIALWDVDDDHDWVTELLRRTEETRSSPDSAVAWAARAICQRRIGQQAAARQDCDRAVEITRDAPSGPNLDLLCIEGLMRRVADDVDGAIAIFDEVLRVDPTHRRARLARIRANIKRDDFSTALDDIDVYARIYADRLDDTEHALRRAALNGYHARVLELLDRHPSDLTACAPMKHVLGHALSESGDSEAAIVAYSAAIELDPNEPLYLQSRSVELRDIGRLDLALADAQRHLEVEGSAQSHSLLGWTLFRSGDGTGALSALTQAIEIDPRNAEFWHQRAFVNHQLIGEFEAAAEDYGNAVAIDPNNAWLRNHHAVALSELGRFEESLEGYDAAIAIDDRQPAFFSNRAHLRFKLGDHEAALADYRRATELEPENANHWYNAARTHGRMGNPSTARDALTRAVEIDPSDPLLWRFRGEVNAQLGEHGLAAHDFEVAQAIERSAGEPPNKEPKS